MRKRILCIGGVSTSLALAAAMEIQMEDDNIIYLRCPDPHPVSGVKIHQGFSRGYTAPHVKQNRRSKFKRSK